MTQIRRWHLYPDIAALQAHAAQAILRAGAQAIAAHGRFAIALAGGATPRPIYAALARGAADWSRWHVYFGDERCAPAGDAQRNDAMARAVWLSRVAVPAAQIHSIAAEHGAVEAARQYAGVLAAVDCFDLVLLGLGEDGHTASLFPGRPWEVPGGVVAVDDAPKPPRERVSLDAKRLSGARQVIFLVAGEGKRAAVAAWRRGEPIPAGAIAPARGVDILIDAAAWPDRFA